MSHRIAIDTKAVSADAAVQEFRRIADFIVDLKSIGNITVTGDINIEVHYTEMAEPDEPEMPSGGPD